MDQSDASRLHAGLRQRLRDRGAAGRTARRAELSAAHRVRALCRAALRLAIHSAARYKRALVALSYPAFRPARAPVPEGGTASLEDGTGHGGARPADRAVA